MPNAIAETIGFDLRPKAGKPRRSRVIRAEIGEESIGPGRALNVAGNDRLWRD